MALTQEQFVELVTQLEKEAQQDPQEFRDKVLMSAVWGYGYIILMLLVTASIIAFIMVNEPGGQSAVLGILVSSILMIAIILFGMILRSLWVWLPKPKGRKLRRKEAPHLFQFIDELSKILDAPKFNTIILIEDLNAAVYQRPRLGVLGWFQNYLLLGFPLMQALTLEQFQAVLAHEFGHLSGQHSRFGNWIYTIKESWIQVLLNLERTYHNTKSRKSLWQFDILLLLDVLTFIATGIGYLIFGWLFERWVIALTAQSFVLSRINEYEADRFAASWFNGQHLAEGLLSIS